jgi:hypothetical protein
MSDERGTVEFALNRPISGLRFVPISSTGSPTAVQFRALIPDSGHSFSGQIPSSTPKRWGLISLGRGPGWHANCDFR